MKVLVTVWLLLFLRGGGIGDDVGREVDFKFESLPLGASPRAEWTVQGVRIAAMGVGGDLQVKTRDELSPPDFGDRFLTIEDTKASHLRLMFFPPIAGFDYLATMDRMGEQPAMRAYLFIGGDYTFRYPTADFGPRVNERILKPGELWGDSYFYKPTVIYAIDLKGTRLGMIRITP